MVQRETLNTMSCRVALHELDAMVPLRAAGGRARSRPSHSPPSSPSTAPRLNSTTTQLSRFPNSDCPTLPNGVIMSCERNSMRPRRRDDKTIRRVPVKRRRKAIESDHHLHVERNDLHHAGCRRVSDPAVEGPAQGQPALRVKHLRLPEADRCHAERTARGQSIQLATLLFLEPVRTQEPPEPHMCVQQDRHRSASSSASSSTDSPGSANSSPEPRSRSQGLRRSSPASGGGASRATTLPRRLMSTGSPPVSTRRMSSKQLARNWVTEMSMSGSYMAIFVDASDLPKRPERRDAGRVGSCDDRMHVKTLSNTPMHPAGAAPAAHRNVRLDCRRHPVVMVCNPLEVMGPDGTL